MSVKSKILIVDDQLSARETLEAILQTENYHLEFAKDGFEALEIIRMLQLDLILLDVMMPGMDGFETCKRIRSIPRLAEVPIIMLTALDDHASLLRGIEAGADDFLSKPIDKQELRLRVRTITKLNRYRTLVVQRDNLRAMAESVVAAQEEERKRISRELHDDIGQGLIVHMLNLRNLKTEAPVNAQVLQERLDALIKETQETSNRLRFLARDIRPTLLDTMGLKSAVQTFCDDLSVRSALPITVHIDEGLGTLSDVYAITLYRFMQETLTNAIKHSKATQIWVELMRDHELTLTVQDNGVGFSEEDSAGSDGLGLLGLRERLTIVGGELKISSSPSKGTIIAAHLPIVESGFVREEI